MSRPVRVSLSNPEVFPEGTRVRLLDESLDAQGIETSGSIVDYIVTEYIVRFDDGEDITIPIGDEDLVAKERNA